MMWRHRQLYVMQLTSLCNAIDIFFWWHEYMYLCDEISRSVWRCRPLHVTLSTSQRDAINISLGCRYHHLQMTLSTYVCDAINISAWRRQHTSVTLKLHLRDTSFLISMMPSSSPREKLNMSAWRHQRHSVTPSLGESFLYFLWICNDLLPRRRPIEL